MSSDQKKRAIFFSSLIVLGAVNVLVLFEGHLLTGLFRKKKLVEREYVLNWTKLPNGKMHETMKNQPENLVFLDSDPETIEPILKSGRWLVLEHSVNSTQHRLMEKMTIATAKGFARTCRIAIRPTIGFEDIPKWLPESVGQYDDNRPVWFALQDGKFMGTTGYCLSESDLKAFVDQSFGTKDGLTD